MATSNILITFESGVRTIKFNRPKKKNALTSEMYEIVTNTLNSDAKDDRIVLTILTGEGDYYSSGNDFVNINPQDMEASWKRVYNFVDAFIQYPKLLIAVVNGPAIGIAATTLALCDVVYASERATFHTPFIKLGLCAEGCSSYLFPRIMGKSTASEMLLMGRKLDAQEAFRVNLISQVVEHNKVKGLIDVLKQYGKLPVNSVRASKRLVNENLRDVLRDTNKKEIDTLGECVETEEFGNMLLAFMTRRQKSKL